MAEAGERSAQQCAAPDAIARLFGYIIVELAWALSRVSYAVRSLCEALFLGKGIKMPNGSGGLDCGNCEHFKPFTKQNKDGGQCQIYNKPIMMPAWRVCKKWQHEGLTENVQQQLAGIEPDILYETTYDGLVPIEALT